MTQPTNKVQEYREAKGLTRQQLAHRVETSYEYIRKIEAQEIPNPSLAMTRRFAKALGISVDRLFPPVAEPASRER